MAAFFVGLILSCYLITCNAEFNALNNLLFNGNYVFIDLSHPFDEQTVYWPESQSFSFTKKIEESHRNGSWYAANDFAAGEHGGTHMDAPYHFKKTGLWVGDIPLEKLIVTLIIVDVSSIVNNDPHFVLHKRHLDHILYQDEGKLSLVIFKFGWSKYFSNKNKYLGLNENNGLLNFPGLSAEVAEWITTSYKNVVGVGVDVASVDPGSSNTFDVHKIFANAGLYNVENVNLHQDVPHQQCTALAMPMKIARGTGAPLRLVAICPKSIPEAF